jgi:hypothetical protein
MSRKFSLVEAQSLIPKVNTMLREAIVLKSDYQAAEEAIQAFSQRVAMAGGMMVNRDEAIDNKNRRDELANKLREAIEAVQEVGCLIKDLDIGLIDFPTIFKGEEVYLCWKLGEPEITFWHGIEEGFRGRKTIDQEFLDHHHGDRAQ